MIFMNLFFMACSVVCSENWDVRVEPEFFINAIPINPHEWISSGDYPEGIVRRNEAGKVGVEFRINKFGKIIDCAVKLSSGFQVLDSIPCRLLKRRARFEIVNTELPARGGMTFLFSDSTDEIETPEYFK